MFDWDSRSVVRSLIGLFAIRSNPVSKVYQHCSRNDGILEVTWLTGSLRERTVKDTVVGELLTYITSADALVNKKGKSHYGVLFAFKKNKPAHNLRMGVFHQFVIIN